MTDPSTEAEQSAYLDKWDRLSRPIETAFDLMRHSFDPGIMFIDKEGRTIDMPEGFAVRLVKLIEAAMETHSSPPAKKAKRAKRSKND